jgi:protein-disulfide isomerase
MNTALETLLEKKSENSWLLPGAIVIAGIMLAVTVYAFRYHSTTIAAKGNLNLLRAVDASDHILGNPSAPVKIIEYADIDSPYAKSFQTTLEQAMAEYAAGGKVAWVYRHLPLIDQHPYSETHAEAAECVASITTPAMFWRFIDALNTYAPGETLFNPKNYHAITTGLGIVPETFDHCINDQTFQKRVANDFDNGLTVGADGSPFTVLLITGQPPVAIQGAIPYSALKKILDDAITRSAKK